MARKLRVEYEGAIYHVMNRGDRRERIYFDANDAKLFSRTLGEACEKHDWEVHAYCLMANHFHLAVETPLGNLVAGMKWFLGTYTIRFNRQNRIVGHLFAGRFKSLIIDGSGNDYLRTVCQYVHLNPVRARLVRPDELIKNYPWSSFPLFLLPTDKRPRWLRIDRVFGDLGIHRDTLWGRRQFESEMESTRGDNNSEIYRKIRQGWCYGDQIFRKLMAGEMAKRGVKVWRRKPNGYSRQG